MDISKLFLGLMTPQMGIQILRNLLERDLGKEVKEFTIMYITSKITGGEDSIYFKVDGKKHPVKMEELKQIILSQVPKEDFEIMDAFKADVNGNDEITITLFYTENGEKQKKELKYNEQK